MTEPKIRVIIELSPQGLQIVEGPPDELMFLGILSAAQALIYKAMIEESQKPSSPIIQPPPGTNIRKM